MSCMTAARFFSAAIAASHFEDRVAAGLWRLRDVIGHRRDVASPDMPQMLLQAGAADEDPMAWP